MKLFLIILIAGVAFFLGPFAEAADDYILWKQQALAELSTSPVDDEGTITFAYTDYSQQVRNLLDSRYYEAKSYMTKQSDDPVLYWISGRLGKMLSGQYQHDMEAAGKHYDPHSQEAQAIIDEYQSYFLKALDLNDNPDAPDHLTGLMLSRIADDVLGTPEVKARAMKKAGDLAHAGLDGTGHEQFEWNTYEARLGIYNQARDYDNYLKTVNEMIELFPHTSRMGELENYKQQVEALIEKRDRETALQDGEGAGISSAGPVEPQAGRADQAKPAPRPKQPEPKQTHQPMLLWLLAGGGIVLLAVAAVFISRRRKRG